VFTFSAEFRFIFSFQFDGARFISRRVNARESIHFMINRPKTISSAEACELSAVDVVISNVITRFLCGRDARARAILACF